jgi:hypothetical protein
MSFTLVKVILKYFFPFYAIVSGITIVISFLGKCIEMWLIFVS